MAIEDQGPWVIAVGWIMAAISLVCVALRMYVRIVKVKFFGVDDYVYILAAILQVISVIFLTFSAHYGFGRKVADVDVEPASNFAKAILFGLVYTTFITLGGVLSKWSLGLFLLRIVPELWHRIVIWTAMASLMCASLVSCVLLFFQCTPAAYKWDRTIPNGVCRPLTVPSIMVVGILSVVVDFLFALLPWQFIWRLPIKRMEKLSVLVGLSLGIIAGAFGIKRTMQIQKLLSMKPLTDSVSLVAWTGAEMTVTMVCIVIPICRPLYKNQLEKYFSWITRNEKADVAFPVPQYTVGGHENAEYTAAKGAQLESKRFHGKTGDESFSIKDEDRTEAEMLELEFQRSRMCDLELQEGGIHRTDEYWVSTRRV